MWNKRGRPKIQLRENTVCNNKVKVIYHSEPLDIYLKKNIISAEEHQCGIRLRWLYTLRYGAPSLQTKLSQHQGYGLRHRNEKWLMEKQRKYRLIVGELQKFDLAGLVIGVCVFNEGISKNDKTKFCYGMQILEKICSKNNI